MRFKRAFVFCAMLLLLSGSIFSLFSPANPVYAQTPGTLPPGCPGSPLAGPPAPGTICSTSVVFVDKGHVVFNGQTFTDINPFDGTFNYRLNGDQGDCVSQIDFGGNPSSSTATYTNNTLGTTGTCGTGKTTVPVDTASFKANGNITGYKIDDDTLLIISGLKDPGCTQGNSTDASWFNNNPTYFQRQPTTVASGAANPDYHTNQFDQKDPPIASNTTSNVTLQSASAGMLNGTTSSCGGESPIHYHIELANGGNTSIPNVSIYGKTGTTPPGSPPAQTGNPAAGASSCDSKAGDLGWIMCPVLDLTDKALNWVDEQIQALLEIDSTSYNNPQMHQAWGQVRNIAYIILVPMMLIMVIGTALGLSFIDAYTVKRAMPRLIIAVIFIALSWEITSFLIQLSNAIGAGTMGIITHPFNAGSLQLSDLFGGGLFTSIFALPVYAIGIVLLLWFFGTTLLLFAAIAFIVLLLRQLFVIALVLVAPLAILAWIFPSNERLWKSWWSMFSRLLLMFPLIMAILALGRVFAKLIHDGAIGNAGLQGGLLKPIAIIIAWMIAYAFIPFTFKFAGGLFATMSGAISDRSKPLFDRAKQKRAENWQGYKAGAKAPPGLRGDNFAAKGFRRLGTGLGAGVKGRGGFGKRGAIVTSANVRGYAAANTMKDPMFQQIQHDDEAMRAATYDSAAAAHAAGISKDAISKVQSTIGFGQAQQAAAMQQMLLNKTAFRDAGDVARTIARVSGGNSDMEESLRGFNNAYAKQVGRHDLSSINGATMDAARAEMAAGTVRDGTPYSGALTQESQQATMRGFENADTYTLGRENNKSYDNMVRAHTTEYAAASQAYLSEGGRTTQNRERLVAARARLEETIQTASSATGINARTIMGQVGGTENPDGTTDRVSIAAIDQSLRSTLPDDAVTEILGSGADYHGQPDDVSGVARTGRGLSREEIDRRRNEGDTTPTPPGYD